MAVAWDSNGTTGVANGSHTGGTPVTYTHTVVSAAQVTPLVGINILGTGSAPWSTFAPTAVKFGTTSPVTMTLVGFLGNNNVVNAAGFVAIYKCLWTGSGAQTVSLNLPTTTSWWAMSAAYTGSAAVGVPVANFGVGTAMSTGAVPCIAGQLMFGVFGVANQTAATPAGSPATGNTVGAQSGTTTIESGFSLTTTAGSTTTETFTLTAGASAAWAALACTVGVPTPVKRRPQIINQAVQRASLY
jgi:hypothetical protein